MSGLRRQDIPAVFQEAVGLHHAGRLDEAAALYRQIIQAQSRHPESLYLLGAVHAQQGRPAEALPLLERALAIKPYFADAQATLGEALLALMRFDEAIEAFEKALVLQPEHAGTLLNLGTACQYRGDVARAADCFGRALQVKPGLPEAHFNLANLCREMGRFDDAIAIYRRAIGLRPDFAEALSNLGFSLKATGRLEESLAAFRGAQELRPDHGAIHSGIVYLMLFEPGASAESIYREHAEWNRRHAAGLSEGNHPHGNDRSPDRRLRIGYVSPDFREHCQSFFTIPLLAHHDHQQFEIFCYSGTHRPDEFTQRIAGCADGWRNTVTLSDEQLAVLVRADQIDILIDLTMHMARGRLRTFARKPAPVQVTWLAYPGTTGLTTIDYRLSDPHLDPPEGVFDGCYSEKTWRLPDTFWCYDPLAREPEVNALPALNAGHVTFGCLNNFCKVHGGVIKLWSEVLRAVAGSKMLILCAPGATRERTLETFAGFGIPAERIEFTDALPRERYLELYQRIDLCLDTFPYNGHTTSLDGLWMGVPAVTLVGETVVGRAGLCQMMNLDMPEFIARTPEEYVRIAVEQANDLSRLAETRAGLRRRMEESPLMDGSRFARHVEEAYRGMWRRWCAGEPIN